MRRPLQRGRLLRILHTPPSCCSPCCPPGCFPCSSSSSSSSSFCCRHCYCCGFYCCHRRQRQRRHHRCRARHPAHLTRRLHRCHPVLHHRNLAQAPEAAQQPRVHGLARHGLLLLLLLLLLLRAPAPPPRVAGMQGHALEVEGALARHDREAARLRSRLRGRAAAAPFRLLERRRRARALHRCPLERAVKPNVRGDVAAERAL